MSVMRNEQWLGTYSSGNALGHHHVDWVLNGLQLPGIRATLRASGSNVMARSSTSRQIASTSADPLTRPCWIGDRIESGAVSAAGTSASIPSNGSPLGQTRSSEK